MKKEREDDCIWVIPGRVNHTGGLPGTDRHGNQGELAFASLELSSQGLGSRWERLKEGENGEALRRCNSNNLSGGVHSNNLGFKGAGMKIAWDYLDPLQRAQLLGGNPKVSEDYRKWKGEGNDNGGARYKDGQAGRKETRAMPTMRGNRSQVEK